MIGKPAKKTQLLLSDHDLGVLEREALAAAARADEVRSILAARVGPALSEFYADSAGRVGEFIGEIRRLRAELQQALSVSVVRTDTAGRPRQGDIGAAGTSRRGRRRADVDDAGKQRRAK